MWRVENPADLLAVGSVSRDRTHEASRGLSKPTRRRDEETYGILCVPQCSLWLNL